MLRYTHLGEVKNRCLHPDLLDQTHPGSRSRSALIALAASCTIASSLQAQLTGQTGAHDPSTLFKDGSNYYYFATGQGIISRRSTNKTNWSNNNPAVFASPPAWTTAAVPSFTGVFWAPDIAFFNGKYHLYYSVSSWGTIDSAIGVATTPSLSSPVWTDLGKVVQSDAVWEAGPNTDTTAYNAIDPSILTDTDGKVWMAFGSYSSGILVTEINPSTGKRVNTSTLAATQVANNASGGGWGSSIEGASLVKKGSFYYLFVNYGGCCAGVNSTYDIRVGRSASPNGPFLDKNGIDMRSGGGSMFLDDDGKMIGPGHFSFFTESGQDQFGYHYYNGEANGAPTYGLRNLYWTTDNWPSYAVINPNWTGTTNSNWTASANWSIDGVPDGVGEVANFISNPAGRYSVTVDGGAKTVSAINFRNTFGYTIGSTSGNGITLDAASGDTQARINVSDGNHRINAPITAVDPLGANVTLSSSTLTLGGTVSGTNLTKYGFGTLALAGANTYSGTVLLRYGTLDLGTGATLSANNYTSIGANVGETATLILRGNSTYTSPADFNVGDTGDSSTSATGTLELRDTASLTIGTSGGFFVGSGFFNNTRAIGTVNQTGGTLTVTNTGDGYFIIGGRASSLATGIYNLSGGSVTANTNVRIGGYGTGTLNQTGGAFNTASYLSIGRFSGSTGAVNVSGGTLNQSNASLSLIVGEAGSGTMNISGSGNVIAAGQVILGLTGGTGTLNLNGGMLTTTQISKGTGIGSIYFDGGTLRASVNKTTFLPNSIPTTIEDGGAIVDTNGFNITIASPLLHDPGLGVNPDGGLTKHGSGTLTLAGANTYTGPTIVNTGKVIFNQAIKTSGAVVIASGASIEVAANGTSLGVSKVKSLSLAAMGANYTLKLELHDNDLIIDYTSGSSPYATTVDQVKKGLSLLGGNGQGIASDRVDDQTIAGTMLGVVDNGTIGGAITSISGSLTSPDSVLVKYTWFGDANLDGVVDGNDFALIDTGFGAGGALNGWVFGDFDYSGTVDGSDYALIDTGYLSQTATLPEPSTLIFLGIGGMLLARKRTC